METYLFKFSACLVVFWFVYILFLERQTMHRFKRFYLLIAIGSALLIPTLTLTEYVEPTPSGFEVSTVYVPFQPSLTEQPKVQAPFFDLETVLWVLYGLGVFIFAIRFFVNLFKMYKRISTNKQIEKRPFIYVLLEECRIPHSFFKYLFFERTKYETDTIPDEVKLHEETHARQLHSLDIITIELLQIVFWFHPLIYILKHHIKLNHEFLADQAVLNEGVDTKAYQKLLLQFSSNAHEYQLSSTINYSSIKKRFTVMKKQTSKTRMWWSSLLLLPIIAILFYSFAEKEYVEKENSKISEAIASELEKANDLQLIYKDGATEAMMKEYNDWMKKLNSNSVGLFIPVGTWERLVAIYDLMNDEQRNSVETHPILQQITPNLYSVQPRIPTAAQFESWKNEKEFAIWLDKKSISNSELNHIKRNAIAHYESFNRQINKLNQPFHINLYTKDGFNKFFKEGFVSSYKELSNEYSIAIRDYLKGPQTDNSELKIIKAQADKFHNQFTKAELDKYNILPVPPVPAKKQTKTTVKQDPPVMWILINRKDQLLVDDELGTLERIESKLKTLANQGKSGQPVSIKYDEETSKEMISKVEELIKENKFKVMSLNISPVMSILINRKDQLLVDDEPGTITSIEKKLKTLANQGESGRQVFIRYDKETSKDMISKLEDLIKANDFKVASFDISTIPPAQPLPAQKQEKATAKQVATYNDWAKAINQQMAKAKETNDVNAYPIVKVKDVKNYKAIYNIMTEAQRKDSEPWPSFPPPPPRPPAPKQTKGGPIEINGTTYYFTQQNGKTTYYDNYGKVVDINKIPPPPPIPNNATPEQKAKMKKATEAYMKANPDKVGKAIDENGETIEVIEIPENLQGSIDINGETFYYTTSNGKTTYYNGSGKEVKMDNLPPPPPTKNPSFLEYIIEMEREGATFYMNNKQITATEAKTLAKTNKGKNTEMTTQKDANGKYIVKLSQPQASNVYEYTTDDGETLLIEEVPEEMSYAIVNGKPVSGVEIKLSLEEFKQLFISHNKYEVVSFSIMFPDNKSFEILGNELNAKALTKMKDLKQNQIVTIFNIINTANTEVPPFLINIK